MTPTPTPPEGELKPCPFCSDKMRVSNQRGDCVGHTFNGPSCILHGKFFFISDWNTRTAPEQLDSAPVAGWQEGVQLIAAERERQISKEGCTAKHDDEHTAGELAMAASAYAVPWFARANGAPGIAFTVSRDFLWPQFEGWEFKPHNGKDGLNLITKEEKRTGRIRDLAKAGALIAAEIDRLLRLPLPPQPKQP